MLPIAALGALSLNTNVVILEVPTLKDPCKSSWKSISGRRVYAISYSTSGVPQDWGIQPFPISEVVTVGDWCLTSYAAWGSFHQWTPETSWALRQRYSSSAWWCIYWRRQALELVEVLRRFEEKYSEVGPCQTMDQNSCRYRVDGDDAESHWGHINCLRHLNNGTCHGYGDAPSSSPNPCLTGATTGMHLATAKMHIQSTSKNNFSVKYALSAKNLELQISESLNFPESMEKYSTNSGDKRCASPIDSVSEQMWILQHFAREPFCTYLLSIQGASFVLVSSCDISAWALVARTIRSVGPELFPLFLSPTLHVVN